MTTLEREILRFVTIIVSIMVTMIIVVVIIWYDIGLSERFKKTADSRFTGLHGCVRSILAISAFLP